MVDTGAAQAIALGDMTIRTVLVVDDSRLQRHLLKGILSRHGMSVIEADSGEAALEILAETPVDMILSDWMMAGISGVELCRRFRAMPRAGYVYFVLLTSKSERDALTEGLIGGADDFLVKPVSGDELRARILAADRIIATERELQEKNRALERANAALNRAQDAVERDLVEARRLQQSLVPRGPVRMDGAEVSFLFQPAGHVGGDLVGRIPVSDTRFGLFSLDVSGHGVAAAMITARLGATLASGTPEQNIALEAVGGGLALRDPAEICLRLNRQFMEEVETDHYFTMLLADVDLATGRVRFVQAGHPSPLLQRRTGEVSFLGEGGLPIGLISDAAFDVSETRLDTGDRLLLYSDGVTECPGPNGEMLGNDGLARIMAEGAKLRGPAVLDLLSWRLGERMNGASLPDDVSGVLLERGQRRSR